MIKVVNLTQHEVNVYDLGGINKIHTFPPSGTVARVGMKSKFQSFTVNGIPVIKRYPTNVVDLPSPQDDTIYIVSSMVLDLASDRVDLVAPDTGPASVIRGNGGRIVGVRNFVCSAC